MTESAAAVQKLELMYLTDPGHGWVVVDESLLIDLGIKPSDITQFSYRMPEGYPATAYLEEDCDAAVLVKALKARGIKPSFREVHTDGDSLVRQLPRHNASLEWRASKS